MSARNLQELQILIRPFETDDQPGVNILQAEFMREFFPEFMDDPRQLEWNADIYDLNRYYIQQGGKFWVAEEAEEIVGVGGFRRVGPVVAEIKRIRIKNRCRGRGLGKALLLTIEEYCRENGVNKILVDTDGRLAVAKAMYEKFGYRVYRTETEVEGTETYINYYFEKDLAHHLKIG